MSLSVTLGLTWIFGFLMLISTDPTYRNIMSWLFSVINTLQVIKLAEHVSFRKR